MRFVLSRITDPADFRTLVPIEFKAFVEDGGHLAMNGDGTPNDVAHLIDFFTMEFHTEASLFWVKVTDADADNAFVAASCWLIHPTFVQEDLDRKIKEIEESTAADFAFLGNEGRQKDAVDVMRLFMGTRYKHVREPHIHLHILFANPEHQRKGAGKIMVAWGTTLADQMMLPCWVEASKQGFGLYSSFGFKEVTRMYLKPENVPIALDEPLMRRPVTVSSI